MAWNNAYEQKKFKEKQEKLADQYRAAGMSESQIKAMYDFDLSVFNSERTYRSHNQSLQEYALDDSTREESDNALMNRNLDALCVTIDNPEHHSRYWWVEDIDDPALVRKIKQLPPEDVELITLFAFESYSQREIGTKLGITQRAVSKRIEKLRKNI